MRELKTSEIEQVAGGLLNVGIGVMNVGGTGGAGGAGGNGGNGGNAYWWGSTGGAGGAGGNGGNGGNANGQTGGYNWIGSIWIN